MEFHANEGKSVTIEAMGRTWARHAIATHFVQVGESYIDLMERYVKPLYQEGDILSMSEKVIAMCQKRIVTEDEVKPCFWAKVLSRFLAELHRDLRCSILKIRVDVVRSLDSSEYFLDLP